jgi:hypothetical protein
MKTLKEFRNYAETLQLDDLDEGKWGDRAKRAAKIAGAAALGAHLAVGNVHAKEKEPTVKQPSHEVSHSSERTPEAERERTKRKLALGAALLAYTVGQAGRRRR